MFSEIAVKNKGVVRLLVRGEIVPLFILIERYFLWVEVEAGRQKDCLTWQGLTFLELLVPSHELFIDYLFFDSPLCLLVGHARHDSQTADD